MRDARWHQPGYEVGIDGLPTAGRARGAYLGVACRPGSVGSYSGFVGLFLSEPFVQRSRGGRFVLDYDGLDELIPRVAPRVIGSGELLALA